ncbi:hypothetical protein M9R32_12745 [Paenisporosarcina quisquiliarum]|uniref:Uncharacterized protein n=1 Tax=Paenisporosarcina quisquiliarum TaxID=365346 RepID=A0A9X3LJB3_9BACL|nr:hypothetical protein [Paenisporosarcina quisquiliarum]MCZ8538056.1 hypothetical protein [Paenisporosarcina quisquiliarum]
MISLLITGLIVMVVGHIVLITCSFKSTKQENKILFQTLPVSWFWLVFVVAHKIREWKFPLEDTEGYTMGFGLILPGVFILILIIMIGGGGGMKAARRYNQKPLLVISALSVTVIFTNVLVFLLYPIVSLFIIIKKLLRKTQLFNGGKYERKEREI